jgi:hypothetical protein
MKRDGRKLDPKTLEEMRILAVRRMKEGEHPARVAASFGLHRTWACKIHTQARGHGRGGRGIRVLASLIRPTHCSWFTLFGFFNQTAQRIFWCCIVPYYSR